ncbi:MAG: DUF5615 family PIN-like protein [Schlesneria sp.]
MLQFLTDEDFNGRILRGLLLRNPDFDVVRAQDIGHSGAADSEILNWANDHHRILLTHDGRTMPLHVRTRLNEGLPISGVLIVDDLASIGVCIDDIMLVAECSEPEEWINQIYYLPFGRTK